MRLQTLLRRFFVPPIVTSLLCLIKYRAFVSPRAEVEMSGHLKLGKGARISAFAKVKASNGPLVIGRNAQLATGCFVSGQPGGLEIGEDALIGPNCALLSGNYRFDRLDVPIRLQGQRSKGTRIGRNVLLGANSVVLDGAQVGNGVIVAPNSVVSGRIPDNAIVQGNPAKVVFTRR